MDRKVSKGYNNFHGLHGNAFLTKCKISDPVVFRDKVGKYFANEKNTLNAGGLEKRLGGRMGLFGRIIVDGKSVVVGSVHKLDGHAKAIKEYIGASPAIVAGDQDVRFCSRIGMDSIVSSAAHSTWPASCSGNGKLRGDNICANNMRVAEPENTISPCVKEYGLELLLSDHALT